MIYNFTHRICLSIIWFLGPQITIAVHCCRVWRWGFSDVVYQCGVGSFGLWFVRFGYLRDNILDCVKLMENMDDTIKEILDPSASMVCG
jgi:hypothetical protein